MEERRSVEAFVDTQSDPPVRGFLHRPLNANGDGLVLTHGAGLNCQSALLIAVAEMFANAGFTVLRCDLPFRQVHPFGPPRPGNDKRDREGLRRAVAAMRKTISGEIFLAGHSYGGRQATMLCAENPELVDGLLLFSYPLHPPRKPEQLRTQHFPKLQIKAMFVHGTRDPLGSIEEMQAALKLTPAKTLLFAVEGAGHELGFKGSEKAQGLVEEVLGKFREFFELPQLVHPA
jgi:hypothetical protein